MSEQQLFTGMTWVLFGVSAVFFVVLLFTPAPYGRHVRSGCGPQIPARLGWIPMETPAVAVFACAFFSGEHWLSVAPLALFALWETHYVYRTFAYPFRMRGGGPMTLFVVGFVALLVTAPYGYLNGRYLSHFGNYSPSWSSIPDFC